jgi:hypothetical protein
VQSEQLLWTRERGWSGDPRLARAHLVLVFSERSVLECDALGPAVRDAYPDAALAGCSGAGEIAGTSLVDGAAVCTAVEFDTTRVRVVESATRPPRPSEAIGAELAERLPHGGLRHVLVLSEGISVNGSGLVRGLVGGLPEEVSVTGGLAADGDRFQRTMVCSTSGAGAHRVVAVGFYGEALRIGYGSVGGWDRFGPYREITKASANILYELDGEPALALYKRYLGEEAQRLPASALLFPLSVWSAEREETKLVRTVLSIDEAEGSMTFAGDMPVGSLAQLMKANFDRLLDGAEAAARIGMSRVQSGCELAILISCVGRRLVLRQRTEEELESVSQIVGPRATISGFYSYGEIAPNAPDESCELHNQTMTVTTFSEESACTGC